MGRSNFRSMGRSMGKISMGVSMASMGVSMGTVPEDSEHDLTALDAETVVGYEERIAAAKAEEWDRERSA